MRQGHHRFSQVAKQRRAGQILSPLSALSWRGSFTPFDLWQRAPTLAERLQRAAQRLREQAKRYGREDQRESEREDWIRPREKDCAGDD
jgi:hypothetical protein